MGNSSSRSGSSGPTIVAEAIEPLPRYSDLCCILGGVNRREHTLLKVALGFGGMTGKLSVKDVRRQGAVVLKSESKSNRKRTITSINTAQGQQLLRIEGTHECVGFRKGCIMTPRGIAGPDGEYMVPAASPRGAGPRHSDTTTSIASSASRSSGLDTSYNPQSDLAFTARALDCTFFEWGVELRSNLSQDGHNNAGPASIWVQENAGMGTVDFTWEGRVVARIGASPGGSIVWNGEKFDIPKNAVAMVIAPGMDWVLISTMCILLLCRQSEHDAGLSTRAGDLSLLSSLLDARSDRNSSSKSSNSLGGKSGGSRGEPLKGRPSGPGPVSNGMVPSRSGSGSIGSAPRRVHAQRIVEEDDY